MHAFANKYEQVKKYLPDGRDSYEIPKQWLANLFNSVIGEDFSAWVRERVEAHKAELPLYQNTEVKVDPGILEILNASTDKSSKCNALAGPLSRPLLNLVFFLGKRGLGAPYLKIDTVRRKTKAQVKEEKRLAALKEQHYEDL